MRIYENEEKHLICEENNDFSLGHIEFEVFVEEPGGYVQKAAGCLSLKLRGEDRVGDIMWVSLAGRQ